MSLTKNETLNWASFDMLNLTLFSLDKGFEFDLSCIVLTLLYFFSLQRLSKQIEVMIEERDSVEHKAEKLVGELSDMNSQARQMEEEIYKLHIEELQEVISQLEEEKSSLLRKMLQRENEIKSYKEQLATSHKNASKLQFRLDKVLAIACKCIKIDH